jgi:hypothetical protein
MGHRHDRAREDDIGDWLLAIVDPLGGDVVQWGFKRTPSPAEYKIGGDKS